MKEESHANIQSEKGIRNRQIRSIQTEGHFEDIKENDSFRRFKYRTSEKEGFLRPKIHTEKKKYEFPAESQVLKTLIFTGDSYFKIQGLKIGINR